MVAPMVGAQLCPRLRASNIGATNEMIERRGREQRCTPLGPRRDAPAPPAIFPRGGGGGGHCGQTAAERPTLRSRRRSARPLKRASRQHYECDSRPAAAAAANIRQIAFARRASVCVLRDSFVLRAPLLRPPPQPLPVARALQPFAD